MPPASQSSRRDGHAYHADGTENMVPAWNPAALKPEPINHSGLLPTADRVLIQPAEVKKQSAGGIILADQTADKEQLAQRIGTVLAMGNTCHLCPELAGIAVGDIVLFQIYSGVEFPVEGVKYRIMKAKDVIGKATRMPDSIIRGAQSSAEVFGVNDSQAA